MLVADPGKLLAHRCRCCFLAYLLGIQGRQPVGSIRSRRFIDLDLPGRAGQLPGQLIGLGPKGRIPLVERLPLLFEIADLVLLGKLPTLVHQLLIGGRILLQLAPERRRLVDLQDRSTQVYIAIEQRLKDPNGHRLVVMGKAHMQDSGILDGLDLQAALQHLQGVDIERGRRRQQTEAAEPVSQARHLAVIRARSENRIRTDLAYNVALQIVGIENLGFGIEDPFQRPPGCIAAVVENGTPVIFRATPHHQRGFCRVARAPGQASDAEHQARQQRESQQQQGILEKSLHDHASHTAGLI